MGDNSVSKIPILIASSLKPTRDSRAWGKLGISLRETNKYALNIIGFSTKKHEKINGVNFYSSYAKAGSKLSRLLAILRFTQILFQVRPKLVICCTYEFLPVASFFKKKIGFKLLYDVQENYQANLQLNPSLSFSQIQRASKLIQRMENVNGIDLYLLAEDSYQNEMSEKQPFLVLENKFHGEILPIPPINLKEKKSFSFLISGTITPAFGILEGLEWFLKILEKYPNSTLKIIGQVTISSIQNQLEITAKKSSKILLETSSFPVSHQTILKAYRGIDFCLLPYRDHPAIREKMPTKLFEAAAMGVPVLVSKNPKWEYFLKSFMGGFPIDFSNPKLAIPQFEQAIQQTYFATAPGQDILWSSQETYFRQTIESLLS